MALESADVSVTNGQRHWRKARAQRAIWRNNEKAKVEGKRTQANGGRTLSNLSFHSLRHSFNSAMANASPEVRQKLTGHTSAETNKVYTHHELESLRAAVSVIPSIGDK